MRQMQQIPDGVRIIAEGLSQLQIGEVLGVDHKTRFLFCLSRNPHVEKARAEFERAQKVAFFGHFKRKK